jgi:serine protease Do
LAVGAKVPVKVIREGREVMLNVPLAAPPEEPPRERTTLDGRQPLAGAVVANMSPAVAEELGHAEWRPGVVVLDVVQGSFAGRFVRPGDFILAVNNQDVRNVADLRRSIAAGVANVRFSRDGTVSTIQFR